MIERALQIDGWMSPIELKWLANTARNCNIIVEFGAYKGRSTRALADNTKGIVYAVDTWDGLYYKDDNSPSNIISRTAFSDFIINLKEHLQSHKVIPYCARSIDFVLENGKPNPEKADLVFIDADHRYRSVLSDIVIAKRLIKSNGIIAGHDYGHSDWPGVKEAVDKIFGDKINIIDSIWWTYVQ